MLQPFADAAAAAAVAISVFVIFEAKLSSVHNLHFCKLHEYANNKNTKPIASCFSNVSKYYVYAPSSSSSWNMQTPNDWAATHTHIREHIPM